MGKGDKKTRRGKITLGTFGVRRPRKKNRAVVVVKAKKPKAETKPKAEAKTKAKPVSKPSPKSKTAAKAEKK